MSKGYLGSCDHILSFRNLHRTAFRTFGCNLDILKDKKRSVKKVLTSASRKKVSKLTVRFFVTITMTISVMSVFWLILVFVHVRIVLVAVTMPMAVFWLILVLVFVRVFAFIFGLIRIGFGLVFFFRRFLRRS